MFKKQIPECLAHISACHVFLLQSCVTFGRPQVPLLYSRDAAAAAAAAKSDSVSPQRQQPTRLPRPWDSLGKNAGVGCHFLLQVGMLLEANSGEVG